MELFTAEKLALWLQAAGAASACPVYFVGAGGCGMSALAHLMLDAGYAVFGSDTALSRQVLDLRARGARIWIGHNAEQISAARPALVVYSSAIRLQNPELVAAQQKQIPIVRRATLLSALQRGHRGICVAGMHGKTTTSAWLALALEQLGANPSYAIGADVPQLERNGRLSAPRAAAELASENVAGAGKQSWFVAETDESDGSLTEFQPEHAVILNVDEEHLDYYANLDAICREFQQFADQTSGRIIFCADDARLTKLFMRRPGAISYGVHPLAAYRLQQVNQPEPGPELVLAEKRVITRFEVWHAGARLGQFSIGLLGDKNLLNAAAVIALLHQIGYEPSAIQSAISGFRGAARRLQPLYGDEQVSIFEDYGHHPSEITATLRALRTLQPRRILTVFQPHRFSRTHFLLRQFGSCFGETDRLWVTDIYAASEEEMAGVTSEKLTELIRQQGGTAEYVPRIQEVPERLRAAVQPGDVLLFLGAGDITHTAQQFAADWRQQPFNAMEHAYAELAGLLSRESVVRRHEPLAKRTTLRVGGPADCYIEPASESDLAQILHFCQGKEIPVLILGRGSNILIRDRGIRGVVVCLAAPQFCRLEVLGEQLHCGAGARLKHVANEARRLGISGLEFLEGIPGTIGGALRMNAGAMGSWIFEAVESIRFMDRGGVVQERKAAEVNVEYRGCPLLKSHIALSAVLKGAAAPRRAIEETMLRFSQKRWDTQPAAASAGCIFKNPSAGSAGKIIDELGLKGTRVGGAVISPVHGNFIVNEGNATAEDVLALIQLIKSRAKAVRGIDLETEVEILGE